MPARIPAHWINNRWSQEWGGLVEAASLDRYFTNRTPESPKVFNALENATGSM